VTPYTGGTVRLGASSLAGELESDELRRYWHGGRTCLYMLLYSARLATTMHINPVKESIKYRARSLIQSTLILYGLRLAASLP
jgi:hypothetical protein